MEKRWARTECSAHVQRIMRKRKWNIGSAVCIGIGSFSIDWEHRYRSLWQLVLFMDVVRQRKYHLFFSCEDQFELFLTAVKTVPGDVRLYAQEPAFTPLDVKFLKSLNITVLDTDIEDQISDSTFVFAPFVDWFILLPVFLKDKDPELYLGNEILQDYTQYAGSAEKRDSLPVCHEVGRQFAQGRDRVWLHDFEFHANALNGLMMYWKQEDEVD